MAMTSSIGENLSTTWLASKQKRLWQSFHSIRRPSGSKVLKYRFIETPL